MLELASRRLLTLRVLTPSPLFVAAMFSTACPLNPSEAPPGWILQTHSRACGYSYSGNDQRCLQDAALDAWRQAAVPKLVQALSKPDRTNLRDHTIDSVMSHYKHYSFLWQGQPHHPARLRLEEHLEPRVSSLARIEHSPFVGSSVLDTVTLEESEPMCTHAADHEQLLCELMQKPDTFYNFTGLEPWPSPLAKLIASTSGYPLNCEWFVQTLIDSSKTDWSKVMGYIAPSTCQELSRHGFSLFQ